MVIINEQDVCDFLSDCQSVDALSRLSAAELRVVCQYLDAPSSTMNKSEMISFVTDQLFQKSPEDPSEVSAQGHIVPPLASATEFRDEVSKPETQKQEEVVVDRDMDSNEIHRLELQVRLEEAQAEKLRLQIQLGQINHTSLSSITMSSQFDPSRAVKLIPRFSEDSVEEFFAAFERIADTMKWPVEYWPILLQQSLTGKALRVYTSLSNSDSKSYEVIKREVLKAYDLVSEAYRQQFRKLRKKPDQTHLEFARLKREALSRWLRSKEVSDYSSLLELILTEEFLRTVTKEVSTYLLDKEFVLIEEAAKYADGYVLRHARANTDIKPKQDTKPTTHSHSGKQLPNTTVHHRKGEEGSTQASSVNKHICSFCGKSGHQAYFCWRKLRQSDKPKAVMTATMNAEAEKVQPPTDKSVALVSPPGKSTTSPQESEFVPGEDTSTGSYAPFLSKGYVIEGGEKTPITILRDSGSLQTLIRAGVAAGVDTGKHVVLGSLWGQGSAPLVQLYLDSNCFCGSASVAVLPELPVQGVDCIIGNDLAGSNMGKSFSLPVLCERPQQASVRLQQLESQEPHLFPLCAVTRSMAKSRPTLQTFSAQSEAGDCKPEEPEQGSFDIAKLFANTDVFIPSSQSSTDNVTVGRTALIDAQQQDDSLQSCREQAQNQLSDSGPTTTYTYRDGVLYRRWLPPTHSQEDAIWATVEQIVVPLCYRQSLLELAHDGRFSGHLGVRKTFAGLARKFYWPGMRKDVSNHVKTCSICQKVRKKCIPPAPLVVMPHVPEPFTTIQLDIVGPLPKTSKGHEYILTMIDVSTRYLHAVALRKITAKVIVNKLIDFFTHFGLPYRVQTDGASYFVGNVFKSELARLGIEHCVSSPYHPQSQGAIERAHRTLKEILRKYATQYGSSWDDDLPYLLFVLRDAPNESTGFSPFELVFAHNVRGPLHVVRDRILGSKEESISVLSLIGDVRHTLLKCWNLASNHLQQSQVKMKTWYDKKARHREFQPGEQVLVLLPFQGHPLQAKFSGPYRIIKQVSPTNYVVSTPDRRRSQRLCHLNMLLPYHARATPDDPEEGKVTLCVTDASPDETEEEEEEDYASPLPLSSARTWESNSKVMEYKLKHVEEDQRSGVMALFSKYPRVFQDKPGLTTILEHDIDVGEARPIKQAPYRIHPSRVEQVRKELEEMEKLGIVQQATSEWSSPVTLVPKQDGSIRFCVDYRKVNALTRKDVFPLPRVDDCVEAVGNARYLTKIDCLRGFWQVPLTDRAKDISCFSTLGKTYKFNVMPFGLTNAPATFQRLMAEVTKNVPNVAVYLDDVVVYSHSWSDHLAQLDALFSALDNAGLVINITKSEFVYAQLVYLGHVIGLGKLAPPTAKCKAISQMLVPSNVRQVRRFLGVVGYYRRYICNFADVALPLTDLLKKGERFVWSRECQDSFQNLKNVLCSHPVLKAPDFTKRFKLACDASGFALGSALLQEDDDGVDHPVAYYSKKFTAAQSRYSTVEKELLSIIMSLKHFNYYLLPNSTVVIFSDHKPLQYLKSFNMKNQRLTRWSLYLQNFNISIVHVKGINNVLADYLSRSSEL